jgi:predicted RNA-binding protein with PIN domain
VRWIVDGNNVYGSRPDSWWNDRAAASTRFAQRVAEWCRTHDDPVIVVFDAPVSAATLELAGGNLVIEPSPRRGRDAADDHIVDLVERSEETSSDEATCVVSSDRGLRARLPAGVRPMGAGRFRELIGY